MGPPPPPQDQGDHHGKKRNLPLEKSCWAILDTFWVPDPTPSALILLWVFPPRPLLSSGPLQGCQGKVPVHRPTDVKRTRTPNRWFLGR